jgi:hypothetical protein
MGWLRATVDESPDSFRVCGDIDDWRPTQPFVRIPAGEGGHTRWTRTSPRRRIPACPGNRRADWCEADVHRERHSGLRRIVCSGYLAAASESSPPHPRLAIRRHRERADEPGHPVVGEIYPRAMYGVALSEDRDVNKRALVRIDKNTQECRRAAVTRLARASWVTDFDVKLLDCGRAIGNPDDFDAWISAAALRVGRNSARIRVLRPFRGGMLASLSLNIDLPNRRLRCDGQRKSAGPAPTQDRELGRKLMAASILRCLENLKTRATYSARGRWPAVPR